MREAINVPSVSSNAHRSSDASVFVILNDDKSVRESLESLMADAGWHKASSGSLKQINPPRLSVAYAKAGPSEGAAVVFPHGWPYHIHSFVDLATSEMSQVA